MAKYIALVIIGLIALGAVIKLWRGGFNGSGIRDNIDRADKIRNGLGDASGANQTIGKHIDAAANTAQNGQDLAGDIKRDNQSALSGIRRAKDILKKARKRNPEG